RAGKEGGLRGSAVTIDEGDGATSALDRITIPQDLLDRIGPTALPRSSIIISDEPLSGETNYRTEFIAVLSNQPQGGFITRKPTPDVAPAYAQGDDGFGFFFHRSRASPYANSPHRASDFQRNWGSQTGPQRSGSSQTGSQGSWGSQTGSQRGFGPD